VPGAKDVIARDAQTVADAQKKKTYQTMATSSLVFPSDADYAKLHHYRSLTSAEKPKYESVFQPIVAG